jgi:predicted DNA-binding protein (MmcQ/YjbR family)
MTPRQIDTFLSRLPGTTRSVQWKGVIVFKLGGTMFATLSPDEKGRPAELWFKAAPESYETLARARGFRPERGGRGWVALENRSLLSDAELKSYLKRAHAVIAGALSKKKQAELGL